jgi:hypothetical protein
MGCHCELDSFFFLFLSLKEKDGFAEFDRCAAVGRARQMTGRNWWQEGFSISIKRITH